MSIEKIIRDGVEYTVFDGRDAEVKANRADPRFRFDERVTRLVGKGHSKIDAEDIVCKVIRERELI